ncbi:hypothetical protein A6A04_21035 [Paramagnetospirillum marisnigri]|jgi:hypothetical protein|uniref:Uncharacterized protein n=2 Tax=Paramagnetospirillum TaxID=3031148 RepID=A0A178M774_9PROT|nr:hypothetical protein [Paramagnetospirillum magnetotacticum]OAN44621.1 hypothetical protein A6A04_21035 [Paramagnetospirillum marisnigri]
MVHTSPRIVSAAMGDKIGAIAETDGYGSGVKAMQRGINMLNDSCAKAVCALSGANRFGEH